MGHKPIKTTPLRALVAAGENLRVNPETFEVQIGSLKGRALAIDVSEQISAPPQRVINIHGEITQMPGKITYESVIRIVWDDQSALITSQQLGDSLKDFRDRLATQIEYGAVPDLDFQYEEREI